MNIRAAWRAMRRRRWNVWPVPWLAALLLTNVAMAGVATIAQRPISELQPSVTLRVGKTADWVAITPDAVWVGATVPNAVHRIDPRSNAELPVLLPGEPCAGLMTGFGDPWVPTGPKPRFLTDGAGAMAGTPLCSDRCYHRHFVPAVERTGGRLVEYWSS